VAIWFVILKDSFKIIKCDFLMNGWCCFSNFFVKIIQKSGQLAKYAMKIEKFKTF
jgi:hypothetical protein